MNDFQRVCHADINECLNDDLFNCTDEFHKCVNTRGSYKCECDQDLYFIDGKCKGIWSFLDENFLEVGVCIVVSFCSLRFDTWQLNFELESYQAQISKAWSTSREAFNNKTGSCCYISNHSYLSPGGGSDFFRGGGITWFLGGYGRRSVVANRVYRGGHKNITQPYGRIRYKQGPLTLFTIFNGANNEYIANQIAAPVIGRWEI